MAINWDISFWMDLINNTDAFEAAAKTSEPKCPAIILVILARLSPNRLDWLLNLGFSITDPLREFARIRPEYNKVVARYDLEV